MTTEVRTQAPKLDFLAMQADPFMIMMRLSNVKPHTVFQLRVQRNKIWVVVDENTSSTSGCVGFFTAYASSEQKAEMALCSPIDPIAVTTFNGNQIFARQNSLTGLQWYAYWAGAYFINFYDAIRRWTGM